MSTPIAHAITAADVLQLRDALTAAQPTSVTWRIHPTYWPAIRRAHARWRYATWWRGLPRRDQAALQRRGIRPPVE